MKITARLFQATRRASTNMGAKPKYILGSMLALSGGAAMYASCEDSPTFLSQSEWKTLTLKEKLTMTHNTKLLRFALPSSEHTMGGSVAYCLSIAFKDKDGKIKGKPYTPVTKSDQKGTVDFCIKEYPAPYGVVSRHMCDLQPGDSVMFKGPWAKYAYAPNSKRAIGMVAGGTGLTPMLQIAREILENPDDMTEVSLIFANVSEDDIMLRDTLDALQFRHPNFKVHYVVNKATSANWTGGTGYVSVDMIKRYLPSPNTNSMVLVCGPGGMVKHVSGPKVKEGNSWVQGPVAGLLGKLGYSENEVYKC